MSLQDDIEYLKARIFALEDRVKTSPHFRWGTVVTSVPLTIILDGAADALPGTPANAGPKVLMVGERVRVELQGNRAVVHAVGGRVNDLRGTLAQRVALAMSGAAVEGMRFYDTGENREYVWRIGAWRASGQRVLAEGNSFMNAETTWLLSEKISEQDSGISLVWSAYAAGGATNQWTTDFIPKEAIARSGSGYGWAFKPGLGTNISKYLYVSDTHVAGYAANTTAPNNGYALRYVLGV